MVVGTSGCGDVSDDVCGFGEVVVLLALMINWRWPVVSLEMVWDEECL